MEFIWWFNIGTSLSSCWYKVFNGVYKYLSQNGDKAKWNYVKKSQLSGYNGVCGAIDPMCLSQWCECVEEECPAGQAPLLK